MKTKMKALIAALTLTLMLPFMMIPASAMTPLPQREVYGDESKGIVNVTSDSPVVLESQTITFNLVDYPECTYSDPEELKEYSSTVTTEYNIYNPTAVTQTVKLVLPFGMAPDYGECNTDLYEITVNGKDAGGEIQQSVSWIENSDSDIPDEYLTPSDWYVYEITLDAGERATTAITTPVYPTISQEYEPEVYDYYYVYSPYDRWDKYGSVDIKINTDYYLMEYGYDYGFTKTEDGYTLHLDDLHTTIDEYTSYTDTGISFSLSSSEDPEYIRETDAGAILVAILLLIVIPIVLVIELVSGIVRLIGNGINYVIGLFK